MRYKLVVRRRLHEQPDNNTIIGRSLEYACYLHNAGCLSHSRPVVSYLNSIAASFHNQCNNHLKLKPTKLKRQPNLAIFNSSRYQACKSKHNNPLNVSTKRLHSTSTSTSTLPSSKLLTNTTSSSRAKPTVATKANTNSNPKRSSQFNGQSNTKTKYFTTKTNQDAPKPPPPPTMESELAQLRSEISQLSYLIKQTATEVNETQALSRRAEARAYIIENKLIEINKHVVKIPGLESMAHNLRSYMKEYQPPAYLSETLRKVNEMSGASSILTSKYTAWALFTGVILFWQYRVQMYKRTSEEFADVAAMTLQQDSLRKTIQETLTVVASSPETLASLSVLFQRLISEERTEQHLINLIVRALNSEGVRDAAIQLLEICFRNGELRDEAGEFLKVAANATVLDESVQKNAGVGIQQALKSAVVPWWAKQYLGHGGNVHDGEREDDDGERKDESVMDGRHDNDDASSKGESETT